MNHSNLLPLIEVKEISWQAARKDFLMAMEKQATPFKTENKNPAQATTRMHRHV